MLFVAMILLLSLGFKWEIGIFSRIWLLHIPNLPSLCSKIIIRARIRMAG